MRLELNRNLQYWRYIVSHGQLVLLGVKDDDNPTRRTIVFLCVEESHLPSSLFCTAIEWDDDCELKKYVIHTDVGDFFVTALNMVTAEDKLEFNDPIPHYVD